jgi:hypothetical protein
MPKRGWEGAGELLGDLYREQTKHGRKPPPR